MKTNQTKKTSLIRLSLVCVSGLVFCQPVPAATVQTRGAGSAVSVVDRSATFDPLTSTNTMELGNYAEGGLSVTTGSQAWGADLPMAAALDPFHGAGAPDRAFFAFANGTPEWVIIQTTNQARIHAVEFLYGNTWTTGDIYGTYPWGNNSAYVEWQTLDKGTVVSSGQIGTNNPLLSVGTVIGFFDPSGFDQLQVKCRIGNSVPANDQAIALDNLVVQLTNRPPAPVIHGGDFSVDPSNSVASLTVYDTLPVCQYRLVYAETLSSPAWNPVTSPLPAGWQPGGGALAFTDPGASGRPHRFYRVEVK